jgi:hypothetical protein
MSSAQPTTRPEINALEPGDRVAIEHTVRVGMRQWTTTVAGAVVRTERNRHGLHFRRNADDKVYSDVVVLKLDDGQLSSVTIDEYTVVKKL